MRIYRRIKRIIRFFKLIGLAWRISKAVRLIKKTFAKIARIRKKQRMKMKIKARLLEVRGYPKLKNLEKLKKLKRVSYSLKSQSSAKI